MQTISVFGLWRDSGKYINNTLAILQNLVSEQKYQYEFFFYENDSTDNTRSILIEWMKDKSGKFIYENVNTPKFGSVSSIERLVLLSYYRNKLNTLSSQCDSEICLLLDTDIIFNTTDVYNMIHEFENIHDESCCMLTSNTRQYQISDLMLENTNDSFYDVFALRDEYGNNGIYFTDCPFVLKKHRDIWASNIPVRIMSGFGGLCLIKTDVLRKCRWSTNGHSEHVNFCYEVNRFGSIYVTPNCRPTSYVDMSTINLDACKNIAKSQVQYINSVNHVFEISNLSSLNNN